MPEHPDTTTTAPFALSARIRDLSRRCDEIETAKPHRTHRSVRDAVDIFGGVTSLPLMDAAERDQLYQQDDELVALVRKFETLDTRRASLTRALNSDVTRFQQRQLGTAIAGIDEQWEEIAQQIEDTPAFTADGVRAKASALLSVIRRIGLDEIEHRLAASLSVDIIGRPV